MKPDAAPSLSGTGDGDSLGLSLRQRIVVFLATTLLRLWGASLRVDRAEIARLDRVQAEGRPFVLAFWHEKYVPLFLFSRNRGAVIVASRSPRGRVIAGIAQSYGNRALLTQGDGHHEGLGRLVGTLSRDGGFAAIAVDGPLGPRRKAKSGALRIAAGLGTFALPVSFEARPALRLSRRWDHMEIPLPFSRVKVHVAERPISPAGTGNEAIRAAQAELTQALNALDSEEACAETARQP
ncbi:lysophospholipid acyltransferase family protein [Ostreiculturibacter nitratireducens]|uniref:lysophospholipid acyltransferase family protein n=1 Tax=Ostreiculturibacter nitratireducens TaxID=3075226 RepID=UPI0031B5DDDB